MQRSLQVFLPIVLFMFLGACASAPCEDCHSVAVGVPTAESPAYCGDVMDPHSALALADWLGKKSLVDDKTQVDVLLLSGGGSRGSFSAGLLAGWGEGSTDPKEARPVFEMVTGVSVGAILATWAYLGPIPKPNSVGGDPYELMERAFGGHMKSSDVVKRRWLFPLVDSMYSLSPMKRTFRSVLPTEMILEVGRVYRDTGRQLWIGTTNLESGQFCEWNLGKRALAALEIHEDRKIEEDEKTSRIADIVDHYYDLIIASSANPTVFQSVKIDGEIHVDGGVSHTIFTTQTADIIDAVLKENSKLAEAEFNVFAVVNGRLIAPRRCPPVTVLGLATRSISILSKSAERANLDRIEVMLNESLKPKKWNYYAGWIDEKVHLDSAAVFTKKGMRDLYGYGEKWISKGGEWCADEPRPTVDPKDPCYLPTTYGNECN